MTLLVGYRSETILTRIETNSDANQKNVPYQSFIIPILNTTSEVVVNVGVPVAIRTQ